MLLFLQESYQVPLKFLRVVKDMISLSVKLVCFTADLELCRPYESYSIVHAIADDPYLLSYMYNDYYSFGVICMYMTL